MKMNGHELSWLKKHDILTDVDFMVHVIPWLEQVMVISQLTSGELLTCLKILPPKKDSKKGLENEFSFWEGLPVGAMLVFGSAPKHILLFISKKIEQVSFQTFSSQDFIKTSGFLFSPFRFFPVLAEPEQGLCFNGPETVGCRTSRIAVKSTYGWSIGAAWQMWERGWIGGLVG